MSKRNSLIFSKHALYTSASIVLAMCLSPSAWADCPFASGQTTISTSIAQGVTIDYKGQAVGSELWNSGFVNGGSTKVTCTSGQTKTIGYIPAMLPSVGAAVYETSIPGVGVKVYAENTAENEAYVVHYPPVIQTSIAASIFTPAAYYQLKFIATGTLKPGSYSMAGLPSPLANITYGSSVTSQLLVNGLNVVVNANTCEAINPSITVNIPTADASKLVGGATGPETPFAIGLKCFGTPPVYMGFSDNTTPSNVSTTLSLGAGSTAKGVGLQILYKTKPVQYGPDSVSSTAPNAVPIGAQGDAATVPFSVRYIGTGTITAGSVNAVSTFIMAYM